MASHEIPYDVFQKFKVPKDQFNVEAYAEASCMYSKIAAVDSEVLSRNRSQMVEIYDRTKDNPELAPNWMPETLVPPEKGPEGVDKYLALVDNEIMARTPPATLEDRFMRAQLAICAALVFDSYKVSKACRDHRTTTLKVARRQTAMMQEWMTTVMPRIEATGDESLLEVIPVTSILGIRQTVADPAPLTPPPSSPVDAPSPPTETPPYLSLSHTEVENFLEIPRTMMGVRFTCTPPNAEDEDLEGEWSLVSHAWRVGDDAVVDEEYEVRLEAFADGPMAMGRDEVHYLLAFSRLSS